MANMFRQRSVNAHQFAMVPRADIPRASFNMQKAYKTTFDAGYLVPVFCEEILPGDTFRVKMTAFARLATPIFPIMDNLYLESFFFFIPNRLVWDNFQRFMGEQTDPGDSTDYLIPQVTSNTGGFLPGSVFDYFGLPTAGQIAPGETYQVNALPFRAYNLIWNEWFRDENLQLSEQVNKHDGPDSAGSYGLLTRGKRHDYFTSCLPWPQKGESVSLPLGTIAPVFTSSGHIVNGPQQPVRYKTSAAGGQIPTTGTNIGVDVAVGGSNALNYNTAGGQVWTAGGGMYPSNLYADLSEATASTINQLRQAFQIQKLLERDARGGTRYTEIIRAHFGVISPDSRLQRPEFLGGGRSPIVINPIPQTSQTAETPQGNLAAIGTMVAQGHGFSQSFTEHGFVIGMVNVRADLSYQQGTRRMWSRRTRYDFYFPAFAMLGEQAVLNKEIYTQGTPADEAVFGYQERWAEYRYSPSQITGLFRSYVSGTLDAWHLSQRFIGLPVLGNSFIQEAPPMARILAVGAEANGAQLIFDSFFDMKVARPMPLYSVPGLIDHF